MSRLSYIALALAGAGSTAFAQDTSGPCAAPAAIAVRGNRTVDEASVRDDAGLAVGTRLNYREVQRAVKALYATGRFDDVQISCAVAPGDSTATLVIQVRERPVLEAVDVRGVDRVSGGAVRERIDLLVGQPLDPAQVATAVTRIDSLYEAQGYYLARVRPETTTVDGRTRLTFEIDEGRRLAVSGVRVNGNQHMSDKQVVGAMDTKPEGFWWFRKGEFDEDKYATDLAERIPELYARNGYIDFQVTRDTLVVDRERGKALIDLSVTEGPRYRVGDFEVVGSRRFSSDEIERFYPFTDEGPSLFGRVKGLVTRKRVASNTFDRLAWEEATQRVQTAYTNEGYISARVRPVVERTVEVDSRGDSVPTVNLRWEVAEGAPSIINRIEIAGNDHTTEDCIRRALVLLPGDVYSQDRLIRSYQNIANLGFFETPLPPPDTRPDSAGDVDVTFRVKEKQTGNVNFGASMGQGTGVGGFIGLTQPNLFGRCKSGSLNWQFGRYINDFSLSYTDPAIQRSQISGTVTAYHSQARYRVAGLGQNIRTGGSLQAGFPVPRSPYTRLLVSYGAESQRFGSGGFLGGLDEFRGTAFRSTLGLTAAHDTRIDLPFPSAGGQQTLTAQFNGGPLGGTADFQRYTGEIRSYATLAQIGGSRPGSQPLKIVLGLSGRAGAVFGNPGAFFVNQSFSLGGVQFGEQLRGYPEFSISPDRGFLADSTDQYSASRSSFGNAFFSTTAELGLRVNQMLYVNAFYDAGNLYDHPRNFDPTRLFRGAGFGLSTVTPLGPLGIDYAYGFDRVDVFGRPAPKWQFHFKLGQLF